MGKLTTCELWRSRRACPVIGKGRGHFAVRIQLPVNQRKLLITNDESCFVFAKFKSNSMLKKALLIYFRALLQACCWKKKSVFCVFDAIPRILIDLKNLRAKAAEKARFGVEIDSISFQSELFNPVSPLESIGAKSEMRDFATSVDRTFPIYVTQNNGLRIVIRACRLIIKLVQR